MNHRSPPNSPPDSVAIEAQRRLVQAFGEPGRYPHPVAQVEHLETHISQVLLAGNFAYKLKKPVNLGFLDFSTLAARRFYCEEELRLNRRLAPQLYLEVVPIRGTFAAPVLGAGPEAGPVIEYAVKMRRFAQDALLDRQAQSGRLQGAQIEALARTLAAFHARLAPADAEQAYGHAAQIEAPMRENFTQIRALLGTPAELAALAAIEDWSLRTHEHCRALFEARRKAGRVRECHGDLHLGNVAWLDGCAVPFDGIEFSADLRWIDVMSEIAFLVMDLQARGLDVLANLCLNVWLEHSGDFAGVALLDYYLVYRAMVRAKIARIRAAQGNDSNAQPAALTDYARYLALAQRYTQPQRRLLVITHGLSGSGKSRLAQALCARLDARCGAVHLRSDVERKRLQGLAPCERSAAPLAAGLYSAQSTQATYAELARLTQGLLEAGWPVVVDATFLQAAQRNRFRALAQECHAPLLILSCTAETDLLRARIVHRQASGVDASEADLAVLEHQLHSREPLDEAPMPGELRLAVDTGQLPVEQAVEQILAALDSRCRLR